VWKQIPYTIAAVYLVTAASCDVSVGMARFRRLSRGIPEDTYSPRAFSWLIRCRHGDAAESRLHSGETTMVHMDRHY
jgi:hypothetical protein